MRFFYCLFTGHYPVGACAVVVAHDEQDARRLLGDELEKEHLTLKADNQIIEIDVTDRRAVVLLNGDY